jgi:hypothetical protein
MLGRAMLPQSIARARHIAAQGAGKARMMVQMLGLNVPENVRLHLKRGERQRGRTTKRFFFMGNILDLDRRLDPDPEGVKRPAK